MFLREIVPDDADQADRPAIDGRREGGISRGTAEQARGEVLVMIGYCLVIALRTTAGVQWPYEWDAFRDIGAAQTMLDGRYPEDPILSGKTLWYNPLTAACDAVFSAATGVPLPRGYVLLGPWLQLLAPAGFFVLVWVLFGRWTAVLALAAFLFGKTDIIPAWNCASYSPWLLAPGFAQGFF